MDLRTTNHTTCRRRTSSKRNSTLPAHVPSASSTVPSAFAPGALGAAQALPILLSRQCQKVWNFNAPVGRAGTGAFSPDCRVTPVGKYCYTTTRSLLLFFLRAFFQCKKLQTSNIATKAHDWMVGVLGPLFRTAGHTVRTQHGVTASADQQRGDVELRSYLQDAAGRRSLVFDLSMTHDRFFGSSSHVQQNGLLSHPQDLDAHLRLAAQRKINGYRQQYADNQNISFLPAIVSTSTRMHGEFFASFFSTGPPGD